MSEELRPQSVINQEYTDTALQYGDLLIKVEFSQYKLVELKEKLHALCKEKAAPVLVPEVVKDQSDPKL